MNDACDLLVRQTLLDTDQRGEGRWRTFPMIAVTTGAEIFVGGIAQLPADATYDCALAIQVIEHIYHPIDFMKELVAHIKPGGYILLATPDIGGALHKQTGIRAPTMCETARRLS